MDLLYALYCFGLRVVDVLIYTISITTLIYLSHSHLFSLIYHLDYTAPSHHIFH